MNKKYIYILRKKKSVFLLPSIYSDALNSSNNRYCSLRAHLILSYHLIKLPCFDTKHQQNNKIQSHHRYFSVLKNLFSYIFSFHLIKIQSLKKFLVHLLFNNFNFLLSFYINVQNQHTFVLFYSFVSSKLNSSEPFYQIQNLQSITDRQ